MIVVTAFVPWFDAPAVHRWADPTPPFAFDGVSVTETFPTNDLDEARDAMARLIVPLGATIADMRAHSVTPPTRGQA